MFIGNFSKVGTLSLRNLVRKKGGKKVFIEYDLSIGKHAFAGLQLNV